MVFAGIDSRLDRELLTDDKVLKITHQELINHLGSAREVISRHLKQFETEGWISLGRSSVKILAPEALSKLI